MNARADITILVDNKADNGLMAEHGLAFWIEAGDTRILMDTGQGKALPYNARALGIELKNAGSLIVSHGHYDHAGGIAYALSQNSGIDVYCHPGAVVPRYSIKSPAEARVIEMPADSKIALNTIRSEQLHWVTQPMLLAPGIGVTGPLARMNDFEDPGGPFFLDSRGEHADRIDDDQALWIKTPRGLIILVGCSHAGLINTINAVRKISGEESVLALIGGFHLENASEERLNKTAGFLQSLNAECIVPCHCTGERAIELFRTVLGARVKPGRAGMKINPCDREAPDS